ncbi:MAG: DUF1295 domain-containing protein [Spirochaetota bacterium]
MTEQTFYYASSIGFTAVGLAIVITLFFITAPYGRHLTKNFGLSVDNRLAWLMMEAPGSLLFTFFFFWGNTRIDIVPIVFFIIWQSHYFYRGLIYPFTLKPRPMPLAVAFMGLFFNVINTYLQGRWFSAIGPVYPLSWFTDPRFITGAALFVGGFAVNKWADAVLRKLKNRNKGYQIPRGGLYEYISSPNYFGETIEWIGWAVMTWSIPGAVFAFWTAANLIPRAWSHHQWYKKTFPSYPKSRKAIIPFLF